MIWSLLASVGAVFMFFILGAEFKDMPIVGAWWENKETVIVVIGYIVLVARTIVYLTPSPTDDGILAKFLEILKALGLVIPNEKVDPPALKAKRMQESGRMTGPFRNRPLVRGMIKRAARRNGLELDNEEADAVILELDTRAGGFIQDIISYIKNNPEAVLAIIKMILGLLGEEEVKNGT